MKEVFELLKKLTKEDTICGQFINKKNIDENLFFFGAGLCCTHMLELFKNENIKMPLAICDNNPNKWGETINNIPIISLDTLKLKYPEATILITTSMYISEVISQISKEFPQAKILSFGSYEYEQFDNFKNVFSKPQYFPKDIINLNDNEVFLDIAGYTGDTIEEFIIQSNSKYKQIITIEPNPKNYNAINKVVSKYNNIKLINKGISNKNEILYFNTGSSGEESSASFSEVLGDLQIEVDTIDNLISEPVTFIKMDIEGFELKALKGAINTIKKYKPKLAVCIYHNPIDFIEIQEFLCDLNLGYKFHIRHHLLSLHETVLYAI